MTRQGARGLPVLIGVTGHRDLRAEDEAALRAAVGGVLDGIALELPHSPLQLLTPLAEGSDRLVAQEALARGFGLVVPLPMPRAIYEAQFESDASRAEFRALLERAEFAFDLPLAPGESEERLRTHRDARRVQYQQLGVFLVRHAQILLALWDGYDSDDPGGTAYVVTINRDGPADASSSVPGVDDADHLDPWDRGPCHHVVTPRLSRPEPAGVPFDVQLLVPGPPEEARAARQRHRDILARIDLLNREIRTGGARLEREAEASATELLPRDVAAHLHGSAPALLGRYGIADALARDLQRHYRRSLVSLLVLVGVALLGFEAYDNLLPEGAAADAWSLGLLAAYPLALGVAFVGYWIAKRREYQDKHLDYRAFAEGLRVQLFWRLAGLPGDVSDHYLRKQSGELRWIHEAIRVSNVPRPREVLDADEVLERCRLVLHHWVEAQRGYFVSAAKRDARRLRRTSWIATVLYVGSLATTLVVLAGDVGVRVGSAVAGLEAARPYLFVAIALQLGFSVLVRAYSEKMGFSEQALQYQRMRDLFTRAERSIGRGLERRDPNAVQRIVLELGEEALQENADWVLFRRSRGIEIPQS